MQNQFFLVMYMYVIFLLYAELPQIIDVLVEVIT